MRLAPLTTILSDMGDDEIRDNDGDIESRDPPAAAEPGSPEPGASEQAAPEPTVSIEVRLASALSGAVYPLSRRELLLVAKESDADPDLLTRLNALPNAHFEHEADVLQRLPTAAAPPTS